MKSEIYAREAHRAHAINHGHERSLHQRLRNTSRLLLFICIFCTEPFDNRLWSGTPAPAMADIYRAGQKIQIQGEG